jgi:hypothetical protein
LNSQPFAAIENDRPTLAVNAQYPDDEPEPEQAESTILEGIKTRLIPTRGTRHKSIVMNSILFGYHIGMFPGQTLADLADEFGLTKAGLYKRNWLNYGRGCGVSDRTAEGRENMRKARLRFLQEKLPPANHEGGSR